MPAKSKDQFLVPKLHLGTRWSAQLDCDLSSAKRSFAGVQETFPSTTWERENPAELILRQAQDDVKSMFSQMRTRIETALSCEQIVRDPSTGSG